MLYWIEMSQQPKMDEIHEFRIAYREQSEASGDPAHRHFSASSLEMAKEMFGFACRKDSMNAEILKIERWNRWADRWEQAVEDTDPQEEITP